MEYKLTKSKDRDINRLIEYKKEIIFEFAKDLKDEEIIEINNYANKEVKKLIKDYCNIVVDNKIVGCLLLTNKNDGKLLDEIYLEKEYRNKGIGTNIIKGIIKDNDIIYLWVYKDNIKAISLYKKLSFNVILETESRYYMKYSRSMRNR